MADADRADLINKFLVFSDERCEAEAIALGQQGLAGLQTLTALLAEREADLRFWAIRGLWANGSDLALALLIEALQDEEEMVRSGAALALGELRAETAADALARLLGCDLTEAGNHAADALAKIGQPAAPYLIEALQAEPSWVRVRAAKALVPVESRRAIPALFEALEDESYTVRHYAQEALTRMGIGQMVYFKV